MPSTCHTHRNRHAHQVASPRPSKIDRSVSPCTQVAPSPPKRVRPFLRRRTQSSLIRYDPMERTTSKLTHPIPNAHLEQPKNHTDNNLICGFPYLWNLINPHLPPLKSVIPRHEHIYPCNWSEETVIQTYKAFLHLRDCFWAESRYIARICPSAPLHQNCLLNQNRHFERRVTHCLHKIQRESGFNIDFHQLVRDRVAKYPEEHPLKAVQRLLGVKEYETPAFPEVTTDDDDNDDNDDNDDTW